MAGYLAYGRAPRGRLDSRGGGISRQPTDAELLRRGILGWPSRSVAALRKRGSYAGIEKLTRNKARRRIAS